MSTQPSDGMLWGAALCVVVAVLAALAYVALGRWLVDLVWP